MHRRRTTPPPAEPAPTMYSYAISDEVWAWLAERYPRVIQCLGILNAHEARPNPIGKGSYRTLTVIEGVLTPGAAQQLEYSYTNPLQCVFLVNRRGQISRVPPSEDLLSDIRNSRIDPHAFTWAILIRANRPDLTVEVRHNNAPADLLA